MIMRKPSESVCHNDLDGVAKRLQQPSSYRRAIVEPVPAAADVRAEILSIHSLTSDGRVLVAQVICQPIAEFAVVLPIERGHICVSGNRCRRAQSACNRVTDAFGGHVSGVPPAKRDLRGGAGGGGFGTLAARL